MSQFEKWNLFSALLACEKDTGSGALQTCILFAEQLNFTSVTLQEEASLPNLLVVCGDHGMSETGSHGGSSEGEVHTPLLFISSAFEKRSGKDQRNSTF